VYPEPARAGGFGKRDEGKGTMTTKFRASACLAAALLAGLAAAAPGHAATMNDYQAVALGPGEPDGSGNDCAGDLGTPPNCSWNGSPMLAKFDFNADGSISFTAGAFASITADDFAFQVGGSFNDDGEFEWNSTGRWDFFADADDRGITAFSVKGGPAYSVYEKLSATSLGFVDFSDTWSVPGGKGLSHITFFDSNLPGPDPEEVPEIDAASGLGALGAIGALLAFGRERRRFAA
jgi:hypothetical protein